ncbi:uncharacterized protein LOC124920512 [Impatiens glandulifera]|uniref:uncharacterized protein LOC124920512 n=1 Tax=Impatiens glandulifera TaxID=253017 RepID=UPI001FB10FC6|nr:uncharacterized protein LOC124920512 [Impatiens glandulifera]
MAATIFLCCLRIVVILSDLSDSPELRKKRMKLTHFKDPISLILLPLLLFSLFLSMPQLSTCSGDLRGSVSCLDCLSNHDLSGIKVVVKCSGVKELATATTKEDGSFIITHLPSSDNCLAKIVGGPTTLYVSRKDAFSKTVLHNHPDSDQHDHYFSTLSTPLKFYTSDEFMSSKTYDLPFPPEWGFPPSHYYTTPVPADSTPVMPIIGIP